MKSIQLSFMVLQKTHISTYSYKAKLCLVFVLICPRFDICVMELSLCRVLVTCLWNQCFALRREKKQADILNLEQPFTPISFAVVRYVDV